MTGYIYRYRNKINSKVYIGQTINIDRRKREHKNDAYRGSNLAFHRAIRKYGLDNFEFDILHEISGDDNYVHIALNELESKEILAHNSYKFGYNETMGGYDGSHLVGKDSKKLYSHTCINCGKQFCNKRKIAKLCSNKCKSKWRRLNKLDLIESVCIECGKPIFINKYKKTKFCSYTCSNKFNHKNLPNFGRKKHN